MNPLQWLRTRHVLPPALLCLRCAARLELSDRVFRDADLGFVHGRCLMDYERDRWTPVRT